MKVEQLNRGNAIAGELAMIDRALCKTNPNKMYSLTGDNMAIADLARKYEDEFCEIVVKHQKELEEEFDAL